MNLFRKGETIWLYELFKELLPTFEITRQTIPTNRGRVLWFCYTQSQFRKLKIKISSKIYDIEKVSYDEFIFYKPSYLPRSQPPFRAFSQMWKNLGLFLHSKKQKLSQIQNWMSNSQNRFPKCMSNRNTLMCTFWVSRWTDNEYFKTSYSTNICSIYLYNTISRRFAYILALSGF